MDPRPTHLDLTPPVRTSVQTLVPMSVQTSTRTPARTPSRTPERMSVRTSARTLVRTSVRQRARDRVLRFRATRGGLLARRKDLRPNGSPYVGRARFPLPVQCFFRGGWRGSGGVRVRTCCPTSIQGLLTGLAGCTWGIPSWGRMGKGGEFINGAEPKHASAPKISPNSKMPWMPSLDSSQRCDSEAPIESPVAQM